MLIQKWNEHTGEYQDHTVPDHWKLPLVSDSMDELINCVSCGKQIPFGSGYTSHRYHNSHGMGYYECETCYFEYLPTYLAAKTERPEDY